MVEWRKIPDFEEYSVSDMGEIRRDSPTRRNPKSFCVLKPRAGAKGHLYVNLFKHGKSHSKYVHRIVLEAFVGQAPKEKPCAAHGNGDPSDNKLQNLRWASYAENSADSIRHGTSKRPGGIKHFRAKLTPEKIQIARKMNEDGVSFRKIGAALGVNHMTISNAVNGRSYKNA